METLYALKVVLFLCAVFIIFIVGMVIYLKYKVWRRTQEQNENLYNMKYMWLQDAIHHWPVTETNYHLLCDHFMKMNELKFKNREKTTVLFVEEFLTKFQSVAR